MKMLGFLPVLLLLSAPLAAQGGYLGVALEPQAAAEGAPVGARILSVEERSAATFLGLQAGDLVTAVDGAPVASAGQFASVIGGMLPGSIVDLTVEREGKVLVLTGVLGRRPGPAAPQPGVQRWGGMPQGMAPQLEVFEPGAMPELELLFEPMEMEQFQLQIDEIGRMMDRMRVEMPRLEGPRMELFLDPMRFQLPQLQMPPLEGGESSVYLRYPASTPEAERQKLREEAVEKYGDGVEVEFAGEGTMIRIQRSAGNSVAVPQGQAPAAPAPAPRRDERGVEEF